MPRSIEEIDQDIANVQSQIAMRNALGYKHARARAILDHDVSSLDRIYSAMNAAEQNKLNRDNMLILAALNKGEAEADRKRKEAEANELKIIQARPEYMNIQKQMLEAVDSGNLVEAAIYQKQLDGFNKQYGNIFGGDSSALIDARKTALSEKKKREAEESQRRLRAAGFTSTLPTTFKKDADKTAWYSKIMDNPDLTDNEKADEIKRIREIKSGKTKTNESIQGAVASGAADDVKKAKEEREAGIALAKKAKEKQAKGYRLLKKEKDALDKYGSEVK